jgi:hypothetical protein
VEPLPGLMVTVGLTDTQVAELAAALRGGVQPRVRVREGAGQVAGRRGRVVAVGDQQRAVDAECVRVRLDGDGDVLPFAPHELELISRPRPGRGRATDGAGGLRAAGARRRGVFPVQTRSINAPQPGWTLQRALDRLTQGYSVSHVAEQSGYAEPFLRAHLQSRRRH